MMESDVFFLLGHNWCDEWFHLTICLAYFPVIFLEGVLEELGDPAQGVPTVAQCRWKFRNLRSVSARDVSVESPLSCDVLLFFFFCCWGWGGIFLVVKKTGKSRYFVWLGVSKCCFFLSEFLSPQKRS